jgi:hypothetical protein
MENIPLDAKGNPKKQFEVMMRHVAGGLQKAIFIDGEMLDWAVDTASLREAMMMGPKFFKAIQRDIERHFVESVSDFIGRKVTPQEIKEATRTGWI